MTIRAGIAGATGFSGSELLRILGCHPELVVTKLYASSGHGQSIASVLPQFHGLSDLAVDPLPSTAAAWQDQGLDLLFLALPHGVSSELVPGLPKALRVIDLAGDFRLASAREHELYYGCPAPDRALQKSFVYGLPEWQLPKLRGAQYVASPGCFATAIILALAPLVQAGVLNRRIIVDAKTGSSGSGAKAASQTMHASRVNSLYAYKPFKHQHFAEIKQALACIAGKDDVADGLLLQTHSTPLVRGICASIYTELSQPLTDDEVYGLFAQAYSESQFVRLRGNELPNVNWSRGSNFVDIGWALSGRDLVVFSALDNLVKGAAGQAIQAMNIMMGWKEDTALKQVGGVP